MLLTINDSTPNSDERRNRSMRNILDYSFYCDRISLLAQSSAVGIGTHTCVQAANTGIQNDTRVDDP